MIWLRSAAPCSPSGVPTVMRTTSASAAADAESVTLSLPARTVSAISASSPGSLKGLRPAATASRMAPARSTPVTE